MKIVKVTQKHIKAAMAHRNRWNNKHVGKEYLPSRCCAISRALNDAFQIDDARSCKENVTIGPGNTRNASPEIEEFVKQFDGGRPVKPFQFDFDELPPLS